MSILLQSLAMTDFGPYRGRHEIDFGGQTGVWIVYGDNGRGKTFLSNAFRYALYGQIRGRRGMRSAAETANQMTRREVERATLSVEVSFEYEGVGFTVSRSFDEERRPGERLVVQREGTPLSRDESQAVLAGMLPVVLSQFVILDSEDLKPYENLVDAGSNEGEKLRGSIEQLLGLPILRSAGRSAAELNREVQKSVAKLAQARKHTRLLGESLSNAIEVRDTLRDDHAREQSELVARRNRLEEIDRIYADQAREIDAFQRLEKAREERKQKKADRVEAQRDLSDFLPDLWMSVASGFARAAREAANEDKLEAGGDLVEHDFHKFVGDSLKRSSACPACGVEMSDSSLEAAQTRSEEHLTGADHGDLVHRLETAGEVLRDMSIVVDGDRFDAIDLLEKRVGEIDLEIEDRDQLIAELDELVAEAQELNVVDLRTERNNLLSGIEVQNDRIKDVQNDLTEQVQAVKKLRTEIEQKGGTADPMVEKLDTVSRQLSALFEGATDAYRTRVRDEVESAASDVFGDVAAEPDYESLLINDNFGLTIVDGAGRSVEGRSAGYEHLVALSLIAALQAKSPSRGPLIMDNPFLRLDEIHTRDVIAALPMIADQVILLTFPGEFDRDAALVALEGHLVAEIQLTRRGSMDTEIGQMRS